MREIKFRGKSIDNGEWVYGCIVKEKWFWDSTQTRCYIVGEHCDMSQSKESDFGIRDSYEVLPETVGQFTGLLDKNGVEIYEGDIVKSHEYKILEVAFDKIGYDGEWNGLTGFGFKETRIKLGFLELDFYDTPETFEVIGNIHDNPELLKG